MVPAIRPSAKLMVSGGGAQTGAGDYYGLFWPGFVAVVCMMQESDAGGRLGRVHAALQAVFHNSSG